MQAAFVANGTVYESAHYVDFARNDLGQIPNDGGRDPARAGRAGRRHRPGHADVPDVSGPAGRCDHPRDDGRRRRRSPGPPKGVCAADEGCGLLPITFSINTTDCAGNGNIQIGTDLWPIVDLATARADIGTGTYEAIYPLCKVGPGGVG